MGKISKKEKMTDRIYNVKNLKITMKAISFDLSGESILVPLNKTGSDVLPQAGLKELQCFELDQHGIGTYWSLLDEDLSIEGLLRTAGHQDLIVKHKLPKWYHQKPSVKAS
tara:strand:+ start:550 stop:882 length:333 start_codon:yes stop_codon:yes gene_type:complete